MSRDDVRFRSGDGKCAAWWYPPRDDARRAPCVVMAHGFGATRHEGLASYAEQFAAAGAAVLVFDYRHLGDSPGMPRQRIRVRLQLEDWRSALAFARARPGVDPERAVLWGFSLSGGLVVTCAARGARPAAVLALCPMLDGRSRVKAAPRGRSLAALRLALRDLLGRHTTVPVYGPPGSRAALNFPGEAEAYEGAIGPDSPFRNETSTGILLGVTFFRPVRKAAQVRCPLWVGIGERDISVSAADAERLAERAPRAELHRYPYDHFEPLVGDGPRRVAGDQIDFLRRVGVLGAERVAVA